MVGFMNINGLAAREGSRGGGGEFPLLNGRQKGVRMVIHVQIDCLPHLASEIFVVGHDRSPGFSGVGKIIRTRG